MADYDKDESGSIDANEFGFYLSDKRLLNLDELIYFVFTNISAQIMLKEFFITDIPRGELVDSVSF